MSGKKTRSSLLLEEISSEKLGIALLSSAGDILKANRTFRQLLGLPENLPTPLQGYLRIRKINEALMEEKGTSGMGEATYPPGRSFWFEMIPYHEGFLLFILEKTKETTGLRWAEEYTAHLFHQIRTPLASIRGYAEDLHSLSPHPNLETILHKVDELEEFLNQYLAILKMKSTPLTKESLKVKEWVERVVQKLEAQQKKKEMRICIHCPDNLCLSLSPLWEQALRNILENSIQYSDPGKTITITVTEGKGTVVMAIQDEGWGFPQGEIKNVLEPFYRVHKQVPGWGLGLSFVNTLAEYSGVSLEILPTLGKGTTVKLTFPKSQ